MNVLLVALASAVFAIKAPGATPGVDPLAGEFQKMAESGYAVRERLASSKSQPRIEAVIFRDDSGPYDRLKVFEVKRGRAELVYLELSSSKQIEFDGVHRGGKLPDLYGDRSKTIAYHTVAPGAGGTKRTLQLLKVAKGQVLPERTALPDARITDVDGDGVLEVVSRSLPLGGLFAVECESFRSMAQTAFRTAIYQFYQGRLAYASSNFPRYFDQHLAALEGEAAGNDPRQTQRYGEYLGSTLSIYFDYAEKGSPQQGWQRFSELFRPSESDPYRVQNCIRDIKRDIRSRLRVPDHWPD